MYGGADLVVSPGRTTLPPLSSCTIKPVSKPAKEKNNTSRTHTEVPRRRRCRPDLLRSSLSAPERFPSRPRVPSSLKENATHDIPTHVGAYRPTRFVRCPRSTVNGVETRDTCLKLRLNGLTKNCFHVFSRTVVYRCLEYR